MPPHIAVVDADTVAVRCLVCGTECPVPAPLTAEQVLAEFSELHPAEDHSPSGCPDWRVRR